MALEIYVPERNGFQAYVTGGIGVGTPMPSRGILMLRDLAVDATVAYSSTVIELPDGLILYRTVYALAAGTGTISAGNIGVAFGWGGTSYLAASNVASGDNAQAVPRVTAGAVQAGNLPGWVKGQGAHKWRYSSGGVVLGTGTFDLYATAVIGKAV